jgi:hypothetical protein
MNQREENTCWMCNHAMFAGSIVAYGRSVHYRKSGNLTTDEYIKKRLYRRDASFAVFG